MTFLTTIGAFSSKAFTGNGGAPVGDTPVAYTTNTDQFALIYKTDYSSPTIVGCFYGSIFYINSNDLTQSWYAASLATLNLFALRELNDGTYLSGAGLVVSSGGQSFFPTFAKQGVWEYRYAIPSVNLPGIIDFTYNSTELIGASGGYIITANRSDGTLISVKSGATITHFTQNFCAGFGGIGTINSTSVTLRSLSVGAGKSISLTKMVENSGNLYIAGRIFDSTTSNYYAFLLKVNSSFNVVYFRTRSVEPTSTVTSLAVNSSGEAYMSYTLPSESCKDIITKFNSSGVPLWSRGLYTVAGVPTPGSLLNVNNILAKDDTNQYILVTSTNMFILRGDGSGTKFLSAGGITFRYTNSVSAWVLPITPVFTMTIGSPTTSTLTTVSGATQTVQPVPTSPSTPDLIWVLA